MTREEKYILQKNNFHSYTIPKRIPKAKVKEAEVQVSLEDTKEKKKETKTHTSKKKKHATEEKKKDITTNDQIYPKMSMK